MNTTQVLAIRNFYQVLTAPKKMTAVEMELTGYKEKKIVGEFGKEDMLIEMKDGSRFVWNKEEEMYIQYA